MPYNESVTIESVRAYLDAHPGIKVLSVVHCETPSGTLNPVREIGRLCRERGVVTVVDVVASLGGIPLESEAWQLDLLVAGPQKCLGGPPGMSLMAVSPEAWALIDANPAAPKGSFLSLTDWRDTWHKGGRFPFTPSVSDLNGVSAAAELMLADGLDVVQARHERVARACRVGVRGMGLRVWAASDDIAAASVTSIAVPDGLTDIAVRDHVREHYGMQLSAGQNAGNIIRIGHMGNTARPMWMVAGLAAVGRSLVDMGVTVDLGAGLEAAMALVVRVRRRMTTLAPFELHCAGSVAEAAGLLGELGDDAVIYAGGTELLLLMKLGFASYGHLVDIKPIEELHGVTLVDGWLRIGAAATHRRSSGRRWSWTAGRSSPGWRAIWRTSGSGASAPWAATCRSPTRTPTPPPFCSRRTLGWSWVSETSVERCPRLSSRPAPTRQSWRRVRCSWPWSCRPWAPTPRWSTSASPSTSGPPPRQLPVRVQDRRIVTEARVAVGSVGVRRYG